MSARAEPAILHRSNHLVVIDKPAGLPCHAGPGGGASVEDWFPAWRRGAAGPWLVHRLDADTAGCLAIARRKTTLVLLQRAFAARRVAKRYWAIVDSVPLGAAGTIDLALARRNAPGGWRIAPDPRGEPAVTDWRVLAVGQGRALLELGPRTGRTHQLRVHCAAIGHPIVGDSLYGTPGEGLCLLARHLVLPLDPQLAVTAGVPPHMRAAAAASALDFPEPVEERLAE